ncbi:MAG: twin-arginine translocation signal domain-containing protein [Bacteroidales bacterium]
MEKNQSRRNFIKQSATAAAAISIPSIIPAHAFGANDRINAAVLGVNGCESHISSFMVQDNVELTHLCDPDMNVLKERKKDFKDKYGKGHCAGAGSQKNLRQ